MDKIINDRKRQLSNVKQMLKMQNLLEEYDRQNAFLNHQVDSLLKQNIKLKQQKIKDSIQASRVKFDDQSALKIKNNTPYTDTHKPNIFSQPRKSRYEYLYDENQLRDLKNNIKNELKSETKKQLSTKQVQTSLAQQIPKFQLSSQSYQRESTYTPIKKPLQTKKLHQSKSSSIIKPLYESKSQPIKQFQVEEIKKSRSKSRQTSQKKLQVISKSRIYIQKNVLASSSQQIMQQTNFLQQQEQRNQQLQKKNTTQLTKQFYLQKSDILQHSFGQNPFHNLQKKVTILETDMPSGLKQQHFVNNDSRISTKFMPLSIESKQFSTNLPKNQQRSTFYHQQLVERTASQSKRRHSLNPSPKVDIQPVQLSNKKIQPFALLTQQVPGARHTQIHRNPSQQKRKFIKIVSSKKISAKSSPRKK